MKRYLHEKIRHIQRRTRDEHVLIIPGRRTQTEESERSRVYKIHSPLLSRTSRYRALLNLRAVELIFEEERPDLIEVGDPYQTAWKGIASGRALGIPVIGFYHSHFPEAYLRSTAKFLGRTASEFVMDNARRYVARLYNNFAATLVPSRPLAELLQGWGVRNVRAVELGVDLETFFPDRDLGGASRVRLNIDPAAILLLYVGRLAPEKNFATLLDAFAILRSRFPGRFHLLVVGEGPQRDKLRGLMEDGAGISWVDYCVDTMELAGYYRAADLFVHPGVHETFGFVSLESQACGTPVVGIRGSYMDRIILHEQEAWARRNTPEALADAIDEASQSDLATLGLAAAARVTERYAWPCVFDRLFSIYREVCLSYREHRDATGENVQHSAVSRV